AGRYPPGILTNPNLKKFIETKLIMVVDPWPDKNIVKDAIKIGIPVIALCDTNNETNNLDLVIPCNNKGKKSLGLIFWILAREYLKSRSKEMKEKIEEFMDE
ncbi:MAG: 30S ribosomal protein S2, partial [Nanoarchaeota archaeon]